MVYVGISNSRNSAPGNNQPKRRQLPIRSCHFTVARSALGCFYFYPYRHYYVLLLLLLRRLASTSLRLASASKSRPSAALYLPRPGVGLLVAAGDGPRNMNLSI